MSLNNTTADALASTVNSSLGGDASSLANWKTIFRALYSSITANGVVTIPPAAIATTGSATNQSGPPAPVPLTIT